MKTQRMIGKSHFLILFIVINMAFLFSCDSKPDRKTEQKWQQSFKEALVVGYTDFKGHFVDTDAAVYIFSYSFSKTLTTIELFSILQKQLGGFVKTMESDKEIVLKHTGFSQGQEVFDEYRFLVNEQRRKVTVMFASLDSPQEIKNCSFFIREMQKANNSK